MNLPRVLLAFCVAAAELGTALPAADAAKSAPRSNNPPAAAASPATEPPATATPPSAAIDELRARIETAEQVIAEIRDTLRQQGPAAERHAQALAELKTDLRSLREALAARPAPVAAEPPPLDPRIGDLRKAVDKQQESLTRVERLLAAPAVADTSTQDHARLGMIFAAVAAVLALGAIISMVFFRPGVGIERAAQNLDRRLNELKDTISRVSAAAPADDKNAGKLAETAAALAGVARKLDDAAESSLRERSTLDATLDRLANLAQELQPVAEQLDTRVSELDEKQTAVTAERAEIEKQRVALAEELAARQQAAAAADSAAAQTALKQRTAEAILTMYERVWPEPFRSGGPLASAKDRLMASVEKGEPDASGFYAALVRWHHIRHAHPNERDRWIESIDALGRACHAYLTREPAANDAEMLERIQAWTRAFKAPLEEAFPTLKLNAVYPGDRFDTDRMEVVSSANGGRQTVQRPLSWFILEKTPEATHVLRRAQVATV